MVTRWEEKQELKRLRAEVDSLARERDALAEDVKQITAQRDALMEQVSNFNRAGVRSVWDHGVRVNFRRLARAVGRSGRKEMERAAKRRVDALA